MAVGVGTTASGVRAGAEGIGSGAAPRTGGAASTRDPEPDACGASDLVNHAITTTLAAQRTAIPIRPAITIRSTVHLLRDVVPPAPDGAGAGGWSPRPRYGTLNVTGSDFTVTVGNPPDTISFIPGLA